MTGWKEGKESDEMSYIPPLTHHPSPIAFFCILLLVCFSAPPIEANSLINLPLNDEVSDFSAEAYAFIYRFLNKRVLPGIPRGSLPLTRGEVATLLLDLYEKHANSEIALSQVDQERLNTLMHLFADELPRDLSPSRPRLHIAQLKSDNYHFAFDLAVSQRAISRHSNTSLMEGTAHITTLLPHVHGQVRDDFAFSTDIGYHFLYGELFGDLFPDEASYTHFDGDLQNKVPVDAYLTFKLPWFELEIGQDNLHWGPGYHGALLISKTPISMDMIKMQASYKHLRFSAFTGILEDTDHGIDDQYLSGHRIEVYLWNRFGFGLSEVVVYGNRFEPSYLNPVNVYLIDMVTTERADARATGTGDNILVSVDSRFRIADNLEIYGELMIDDGNPSKDFHHWDTKFGILGGIYATDPFGISNTDLHVEYAFINQYAYTHENPANVYRHFSSVIGHHIGPDADNLWVELRHRFTGKLETVLIYEQERHGEGNIDKPHPLDAPKDDQWTPLSGITQSEHSMTLGTNYTAIGRYSIVADFTRFWLHNIGNRTEVDDTRTEVKLKALYRF